MKQFGFGGSISGQCLLQRFRRKGELGPSVTQIDNGIWTQFLWRSTGNGTIFGE